MNEFIAGAWLTVTLTIIAYMIALGRKVTRIDKELTQEKTRSIEVDKAHDTQVNEIKSKLVNIDNKMEKVLLAYQDTKDMLVSRINGK